MTLTEKDLLEKDFVHKHGDTLVFEDDLRVDDSISVDSHIKAKNIDAEYIDADDIDAGNIGAEYIDAEYIDACDIDAKGIDAWNIHARGIDADNISYYSFCIARKSLKCRSIEGRRTNSTHTCLDNKIRFKKEGEGEDSEDT